MRRILLSGFTQSTLCREPRTHEGQFQLDIAAMALYKAMISMHRYIASGA